MLQRVEGVDLFRQDSIALTIAQKRKRVTNTMKTATIAIATTTKRAKTTKRALVMKKTGFQKRSRNGH